MANIDGLRDTERAILWEARNGRNLARFLRVSNRFGELSVFSQAAQVSPRPARSFVVSKVALEDV